MEKWHGPSKYHKTLNGFALTRERQERRLSQFQFARECGWSQPFQSRLESRKSIEIHIDIINTIAVVLDNYTKISPHKSFSHNKL